jgi:hypothetical protein
MRRLRANTARSRSLWDIVVLARRSPGDRPLGFRGEATPHVLHDLTIAADLEQGAEKTLEFRLGPDQVRLDLAVGLELDRGIDCAHRPPVRWRFNIRFAGRGDLSDRAW